MFEEFKSAFRRPNNGHRQLIIINVVVFVFLGLLMVIAGWTGTETFFISVYKQFTLPAAFSEFLLRPWTLITYFFTHSLSGEGFRIIFHILFNMIALYWFGRVFVEYLGSDKVIAVYVLGGIAGGILFLMAYNLIPNPPPFLAGGGGLVGASAAVFAVMVATATLLPDYSFFLLFIGPVKIKWIAAVYVLISILSSVGSNAGGEVSHLGGALMGYVYTKQLQAGVNWGGWITSTLYWIGNLFTAKPKVKVSYRKSEPSNGKKATNASGISQKEIDAILDKISDGGYESLTKDEKEKLFKASKK